MDSLGLENNEIHDSAIMASSEGSRYRANQNRAVLMYRQRKSKIDFKTVNFFHTGFATTKPPTCMDSLGLENNETHNSAITASSEDIGYTASHGRLYQQGFWLAEINGTEQWFQVDFVNWTKVTGVAIQGSGSDRQGWVTKFKLAYSYDGEFFSDYREHGDSTKVLF